MKERLGIIKVSGYLYREPATMQKLFRFFTPIRTEFKMWDNTIEILGKSDQFEECVEGERIPEYYAIITETSNNLSVSFQKS